MFTFKMFMGVAAASLLAANIYSADTLIEGFENTADPGGWRSVSPAPQTMNATLDTVPIYVTEHVTQGIYAGQFTTTWTIPGGAGASNPYYTTGTLTFWAVRYNVAIPTAFTSIPNTSKLRVDVFNNSADTIMFSLCVRDQGGAGGLERGPFKPLAGNTTTTYEWNMVTEPCTSFVTGNGVLEGTSSVLRGCFIYTETEPTQAAFSMDVDNLRIVDAQTDLTAPAPPVLLSTMQGPNPGEMVVKWAPNTESDLAQYRIYMATDANFGVPIGNRFGWPGTPTAIVLPPATQTTLTDVPTTGPVYIRLTARDNATPSPNESFANPALGTNLKPDGLTPDDLVVLDLKRFEPGPPEFELNGYAHMIVYDSQALNANNRTFQSCMGTAVSSGVVTLAPSFTGVTIWSCALDGVAVTTPTLTDENVTNLTNFVNNNGNLLISGIYLGRDLQTNGTPSRQAFYTDVLKANLATDSVATNQIDSFNPPFAASGTFNTGDNAFDFAAWATTSNEGITTQTGALPIMDYNPVPVTGGQACVYWGYRVVYFGFGFESVRDNANATFAGAAAKRATIMNEAETYLLDSSEVSDWQLF